MTQYPPKTARLPHERPGRGRFMILGAAMLMALGAGTAWAASGALSVTWPTANSALSKGGDLKDWAQDTGTGDPHSGLFGCVRNDGNRFHEGIDIKSISRDRAGEPLDAVMAVMEGQVAYISNLPGNSSYGRYIVLEHTHADVPVYTLYAHLAAIEPGLKIGQRVGEGQRIARMGHSSADGIPKERAHLHFEIGLRMTDNFQPWYDAKKFGSPNSHGVYNGMNLIAFDPTAFFDAVRTGKLTSLTKFIRALPTAYTLRVTTAKVPDFVRRYPSLLTKPVPSSGVAGWDIQYTWYGLPKQWTPLAAGTPDLGAPGSVALVSYDKELFDGCDCRETLLFNNAKPKIPPKLGPYQTDELKMVFGK